LQLAVIRANARIGQPNFVVLAAPDVRRRREDRESLSFRGALLDEEHGERLDRRRGGPLHRRHLWARRRADERIAHTVSGPGRWRPGRRARARIRGKPLGPESNLVEWV